MSRLTENQPARFTEFLAALRSPAPAGATLRFLHLLIPHSPWLYLASGTRYDGPGDLPFEGRWWARLAYQRHLQQVGLRRSPARRGARGAAARPGGTTTSLVVVTSDHGDSFSLGVSGRDMDDGQRAAAELAWVPLFIKAPGQRAGGVDDRNWQHVDLLPTLAGLRGLRGAVAGRRRVGARPTAARAPTSASTAKPGRPVTIDPARHFPAVLRGPAARPVLRRHAGAGPGRAARWPTSRCVAAVRGRVANRAEFADVHPDERQAAGAGATRWCPTRRRCRRAPRSRSR